MHYIKKHDIRSILEESSLPRLETEILASFLLGQSREYLLTHPETGISHALYGRYKNLETKRLEGWPIAYLTGQKEFYGLSFKVNPAVLTPRPETEMMVEEIIAAAKRDKSKKAPLIVDLGTGSGAIIVASATELRKLSPALFMKTKFMAVDISRQALNIAKENSLAHKLGRRIEFFHGNLLTPLKLNERKLAGRHLIIAANLPYLTKSQIKDSPSIQREPKLALDGGPGGLRYYKELFRQLADLELSGIHARILCEIDPAQTVKIRSLIKKYLPQAELKIKKDLSRKDRLAIIQKAG